MIILGADYPYNPRLIFITGLQIIIYKLTLLTFLCTNLFFKRYLKAVVSCSC